MKNVTGWDFWRFCFRLGLRESVRGLDYFRFYEYPRVLETLSLEPGCSVLDLGCGTGLFPLFCASHFPEIRYTAVDIDDGAIAWQKKKANRLRGPANLEICPGDSRSLGFPSESFDRVANLGSIEHIPGDGDIRTAREMGRVCRPGGRLVLSIPYGKTGGEAETTPHWKSFERRYDERMLEDRLIGPSGCRILAVDYFGEPGFRFSKYWYRLPFALRLPVRHFAPLASRLWLKTLPSEERSRACGVRLVLEKPGPERRPEEERGFD